MNSRIHRIENAILAIVFACIAFGVINVISGRTVLPTAIMQAQDLIERQSFDLASLAG